MISYKFSIVVAAYAARVFVASLSMGLRPRLSAAAASRLDSNPRADARYMFSSHFSPGRWTHYERNFIFNTLLALF